MRWTWRRLASFIVLPFLFPLSHGEEGVGPSLAPSSELRHILQEMQARSIGAAPAFASRQTPPEPSREEPSSGKGNVFRSRTGVVIMVIVGTVVLGSLARARVRDKS